MQQDVTHRIAIPFDRTSYFDGRVQILNNLGNKERARPYPHLDWFVN